MLYLLTAARKLLSSNYEMLFYFHILYFCIFLILPYILINEDFISISHLF